MEIRTKKKVQLWKKAIVHFSLCFVMGFFTGLAPTGKSSIFSNRAILSNKTSRYSPETGEMLHQRATPIPTSFDRSLIDETPLATEERKATETIIRKEEEEGGGGGNKLSTRRLIIIVTPMSSRERFGAVFLRKLACSIRLVPPPLLWIVVEQQTGSDEKSEMLRKTGIMYRHLVFKENFTDPEAELDHQRNIALKHIEQHRLSGIVHFAGIYNVYDLGFFNELRGIEVFGTWPTALLSANKKKVIIKGPVCDSSQVIGWHIRKINNQTDRKPPIHVSSFGFNSSILWDPERWGRPSSSQQTSQDSIKFVKEVALEDETKLKGIPQEDCSRIMLWRFHFPILTSHFTTSHPLTSGR